MAVYAPGCHSHASLLRATAGLPVSVHPASAHHQKKDTRCSVSDGAISKCPDYNDHNVHDSQIQTMFFPDPFRGDCPDNNQTKTGHPPSPEEIHCVRDMSPASYVQHLNRTF